MTVSSSNIKSNITKLKNKVLSINKNEIFCSQALDELYGLHGLQVEKAHTKP